MLALGLALSATALAVAAQYEPSIYPGDPVGPDDLVFVDLDSSANTTCGITKADNLRCWRDTRVAPVRATASRMSRLENSKRAASENRMQRCSAGVRTGLGRANSHLQPIVEVG